MEPMSVVAVSLITGGILIIKDALHKRKTTKKREADHHRIMIANPHTRYLHPDLQGTIREKPTTSSRPTGWFTGDRKYIHIDGYAIGEEHQIGTVISDVWFRFEDGYIWSGLTHSHSTLGLRNFSAPEPIKRRQITPEDRPDITYEVSSYAREIEKTLSIELTQPTER